MKTTARFIISATTGLGLAAFILFSAFASGANAPATVIAFALLVSHGLIEIAIQSYSTPRFVSRPLAARRSPRLVPMPVARRASAIVELSGRTNGRRAA